MDVVEDLPVHRHEPRYISAARVALRTSMLSASMKRTMLSPLGSIRTWFPPGPGRRSGAREGVPRYTTFRREIFATTTRDGSGQRMNSVVRPFGSITFWYGVPS